MAGLCSVYAGDSVRGDRSCPEYRTVNALSFAGKRRICTDVESSDNILVRFYPNLTRRQSTTSRNCVHNRLHTAKAAVTATQRGDRMYVDNQEIQADPRSRVLLNSARLPPRRFGFNSRPGHSGFSHVGIVPDNAVGRRVFSGISPIAPTLSIRRCSIPTSITLIGSQDLARALVTRFKIRGGERAGGQRAADHVAAYRLYDRSSPGFLPHRVLCSLVGSISVHAHTAITQRSAVAQSAGAPPLCGLEGSGFKSQAWNGCQFKLRHKVVCKPSPDKPSAITLRDRYDGNTARLARRSDEALEVRVSVARIAPSLLSLGHKSNRAPVRAWRLATRSVEQRRNSRVGETEEPRENPLTSIIAWHDSHLLLNLKIYKPDTCVTTIEACSVLRYRVAYSNITGPPLKVEVKQLPMEHCTRLYSSGAVLHRQLLYFNLKVTFWLVAYGKTARQLSTLRIETTCLPTRRTGSIRERVALGFSHVGIAQYDAAGRRVFSGISRFSRHLTPTLLHTHIAALSSALKTSISKENHLKEKKMSFRTTVKMYPVPWKGLTQSRRRESPPWTGTKIETAQRVVVNSPGLRPRPFLSNQPPIFTALVTEMRIGVKLTWHQPARSVHIGPVRSPRPLPHQKVSSVCFSSVCLGDASPYHASLPISNPKCVFG
ncbi:hypothetical protein PR048_025500 [Dryococelus australis]|uniref:Uncharacterized protein n=1 Tax=Dryococelus australis TaxID=614101 RepID=A0ABQ9GRL9_9NEOP|nr:hypothetical protein PR048_025500 [Dryococelus australis]